jgi:cytoskeletal protein RodZ
MVERQNAHEDNAKQERNIWLRGFIMIVFVIFFGIAEALLFLSAVFQFFWMVFNQKPNQIIVDFGKSLGTWLERVALFQTGASEQPPFPWSAWE